MGLSELSGEEVAELLRLEPLPREGGRFRQTFLDERSSAIYHLLIAPEFSALHRLAGPEVYHFYAGDPARLLLLHPNGRVDEPVLGIDLTSGERPQVTVEGGVWQGAETLGAWTLLGTTMAPPFRGEDFELGSAAMLAEGWPAAAGRIAKLTRL
jgi:predicted cupin superfamily sugar epimerase